MFTPIRKTIGRRSIKVQHTGILFRIAVICLGCVMSPFVLYPLMRMFLGGTSDVALCMMLMIDPLVAVLMWVYMSSVTIVSLTEVRGEIEVTIKFGNATLHTYKYSTLTGNVKVTSIAMCFNQCRLYLEVPGGKPELSTWRVLSIAGGDAMAEMVQGLREVLQSAQSG